MALPCQVGPRRQLSDTTHSYQPPQKRDKRSRNIKKAGPWPRASGLERLSAWSLFPMLSTYSQPADGEGKTKQNKNAVQHLPLIPPQTLHGITRAASQRGRNDG